MTRALSHECVEMALGGSRLAPQGRGQDPCDVVCWLLRVW